MVRFVVVLVLALALPAGALAQSAGDQQYNDPFGGKNKPTPTATSAATTYATSAPTAYATSAPTYAPTAVPTEDPQVAVDAAAAAGKRVGKRAKPPVQTQAAQPMDTPTPVVTAPAGVHSSDGGGGGTTVGIVIIVVALLAGGGLFAVRRTRGGSVADA